MTTNSIWFGTMIRNVMLEIDRQPIIDYAYEQRKLGVNSIENSSYNGWQSPDLKDNKVFDEFKDVVFTQIDEFHKVFQLRNDLEHLISNMWLNINPKGGFNTPHNHPGAIFSGVFYLKTNENSGDLHFTHPAINQNYHFNTYSVETYNNINSGGYSISPKDGQLIMFPSYQNHYVSSNMTDEDRIVLAFNTILVDKNKYDTYNNLNKNA